MNWQDEILAPVVEELIDLLSDVTLALIGPALERLKVAIGAAAEPKERDDEFPRDIRGRILAAITAHREGQPEDVEAAIQSLYNLLTLDAPGKIFVAMTPQEAAQWAVGSDLLHALEMVKKGRKG